MILIFWELFEIQLDFRPVMPTRAGRALRLWHRTFARRYGQVSIARSVRRVATFRVVHPVVADGIDRLIHRDLIEQHMRNLTPGEITISNKFKGLK